MRRRLADLMERLLCHSSEARMRAIAKLLEREMPRPGDAWNQRLVAEALAEKIAKL